MQRNHTVLTCVYGLYMVAMRCITYVSFYISVCSVPSVVNVF